MLLLFDPLSGERQAEADRNEPARLPLRRNLPLTARHPDEEKATEVVVAGGGIAGLCAALAFADRGFAVRMFERAPRFEAAGAGIQVSPNALRVLYRLGLRDRLRRAAVEADAVELRALGSGARLARVAVRGSDGTPYLSMLRADLQAALAEACASRSGIAIEHGREVAGIVASPDGKTTLRLRTGSGDLTEYAVPGPLVAADGVRSAVAAALGHPPARRNGVVAWRLTLDIRDCPVDTVTSWLGAECHVVAYPVANGARSNVVVVAGPDRAATRQRLRSVDPRIAAIAAAFDAATPWPLVEADRPPRPGDPTNVLLIGDAAHAMLPFAAQGAALAIEDGFVAAALLAESPDTATAWRRFARQRQPRWRKVRRRVAFHRIVYHLPVPFALARDTVLRHRNPEQLGAALAWLYDWWPPD